MHNEAYRSDKYRLTLAKSVRSGKIPIFKNISVRDTDTFLLDINPEWSSNIQINKVYERKDTDTYVYQLTTHCGFSCGVKIFPLETNNSSDKKSPYRNSNGFIEVRYLKLLNELVAKQICPHTTLLYGHALLTGQDLSNLFPDLSFGSKQYVFLLSEMADNNLNVLTQSPHTTEDELIALLFQVFVTLATVQAIFPDFRHNDLHMANVLIQDLKPNQQNSAITKYKICGKEYWVDLTRFPRRVLLWDMYYASTRGRKDVIKDNLTPCKPTLHGGKRTNRNQYFDIHKLLDSMDFIFDRRKLDKKFPVVKKFIDDVVPERLKAMTKNLSQAEKKSLELWNQHIFSPKKILETHEIFEKFRCKPPANAKLLCCYQYPPQTK